MSKIKVLPVYPKFPLTFWSYKKSIEYTGKKAIMPPTGLATVVAMLPEDKFEVMRIIDLNVEDLKDEDIKNADVIMTSTMIVQEESHNEVVKRVHKFGKKVIAGGPFVTTYPERTKADYILAGEAEVVLEPFLMQFLKGTEQRIWTEENVRDVSKAKFSWSGKVSITETPLPRWDLLDLNNYFSAAIQYSRGCPFNCEFCDITKLFGRESRTKTPEQMIREFDALYATGHRGSVFIVDDNFIGNGKNVKELLPYIIKWQKEKKYPFSLFTEASMNLAWDSNKEILEGMHQAGFNLVFLGIESVDIDVLDKMHKVQNTKMSQLESVRKIQKAGLEVTAGFIIGSDGEKEDCFEKLFNFIQEAGIPVAMPGLLTAVRGTNLYNRLKAEGRIRTESKGNNTHQLSFNFKTELDEKFLLDGYKKLISKLFKANNYYQRCKTMIANLGQQHSYRRTNKEGIILLGKSLRRQLFRRGGLAYARYLAETALKNPRYFPKAVAQAIKFDHFSTITRETLEADNYIPHTENLYNNFVAKAKKVYEKRGKEINIKLDRISNKAQKIIIRAEKKYSKLHEDFRDNAKEALDILRNKIMQEVNKYRNIGVKYNSKVNS